MSWGSVGWAESPYGSGETESLAVATFRCGSARLPETGWGISFDESMELVSVKQAEAGMLETREVGGFRRGVVSAFPRLSDVPWRFAGFNSLHGVDEHGAAWRV